MLRVCQPLWMVCLVVLWSVQWSVIDVRQYVTMSYFMSVCHILCYHDTLYVIMSLCMLHHYVTLYVMSCCISLCHIVCYYVILYVGMSHCMLLWHTICHNVTLYFMSYCMSVCHTYKLLCHIVCHYITLYVIMSPVFCYITPHLLCHTICHCITITASIIIYYTYYAVLTSKHAYIRHNI